jgi:hypothetical protein
MGQLDVRRLATDSPEASGCLTNGTDLVDIDMLID